MRLTETLADELRTYGIAVNAIAPGAVNTKILDDTLSAGEELVGKNLHAKFLKQKEEGGVSPRKAAELRVFLASNDSDGLSGKFVSAVWDDWRQWDGGNHGHGKAYAPQKEMKGSHGAMCCELGQKIPSRIMASGVERDC